MKEGSGGEGRREWVAPDLYLVGGWAEAGETLASRSISWDRKGNIWGCQRVKQLICDSLNGLRITETMHVWSYVPWTGKQVHWNAPWLGAGAWGLGSNPKVRTVVDCGKMTGGDGSEKVHGEECLWRNAGQLWRQGVESSQGVGPSWSPLSPHTLATNRRRSQQGWPFECLTHWAIVKDPPRGAFWVPPVLNIEKDQSGRPFDHHLPETRREF